METTQPLLSNLSLHSQPLQLEKATRIELNFNLVDAIIKPDGFPLFVKHIFSKSTDIMKGQVFVGGDFVDEIATWLGGNKNTLRVSAKDHFKSMSFYAHIMWKIYKLFWNERNREINYFSYGEGMASYHLSKIKTAIKCNPYFNGVIDMKAQADSILKYSWDGKHFITAHPRGLMEFKRGIHCQDVYVDDPFQDPENKLVPTKINKINDAMKTQILDMYQEECHIAGTAQTNHDFFFDDDFVSRFSRKILPAVVDEKNKVALWKEWMSFEELMAKKKERGEKIFNQEYLCSPVYSENAFVDTKERLMTIVGKGFNFNTNGWENEMRIREDKDEKDLLETDKVAGWDLGKKNHPAHFSVFEKRGKKRVQIHDKWFDRVNYTDQLAYIQRYVDTMGIYKVFYDSTRGELEMMEETGELPGEFEGIHFTFKAKHRMAGAFDRAITNAEIELINTPRTINQIMIVNNELQAPDTPEGHGDAFWSICLTFNDLESEGSDVNFV